ncbi:MAG: glycoside hydrolase family 2 protein [Planctomycetota bacterium]
MKYTKSSSFFVIFVNLFLQAILCAGGEWEPAGERIMSRWAKDVRPDNVLKEYPRPIMVRGKWMNLNGLWDYAITTRDTQEPEQADGKILVPFPVESALSGVGGRVTPTEKLWYHRKFEIPEDWRDCRVLLHFGAVDWETKVYVNEREVGTHRGGYDPFSFDITDALGPEGEQEILVEVWDPTDEDHQPVGKQTLNPRGFWYTAVTGIWQTVWLEPVPQSYIKDIQIIPDVDAGTVKLEVNVGSGQVKAVVKDGAKEVSKAAGEAKQSLSIKVPNAKLWSPDSPFLYDIEIELTEDGEVIDEVKSYFGMRKLSMIKDSEGILRIALNNEIIFQYGVLDQGWWPGGLYRAPSDEALRYDIEVIKKAGFNMLRKHGKVESQRLYYWCDKLGLFVWQDMTPGDSSGEWGTERSAESAEQFELELERMISACYNHPSIITWVIFNEGWGQYDTERLTKWVKQMDASRLVVGASGFMDKGVGDIHDVHGYPGPTGAPREEGRALVLGEFGGLGLPIEGHQWIKREGWGYRSFKSADELYIGYTALLEKLKPYISRGLCGAIYTQITDVEKELNGLMTYDREVIKVNPDKLLDAAKALYAVEPGSYNFVELVPSSQKQGQQWRYTNEEPVKNWKELDFDDSNWSTGEGGFGQPDAVGAIVRTDWSTEVIWLRKSFELSSVEEIQNPYLVLYHDFEEKTEVYLNGELIAEGPEHQAAYTLFELDSEGKEKLKNGENVLAVHGKQNSRRQYVDAGLLDLRE